MFMKIYAQKLVTLGLRLQKRALDDPCGGWGVLGLIFAGYVPLASHYSLIFKIQIFFTFIALFQELTMKKNNNTLQIVKKGH